MIKQKSPPSLKHLDKRSPLEKKVDILVDLVEKLGQKVNGLCAIEKERWRNAFKGLRK